MARLTNRRHEAFAREIAAGTKVHEAYALAGFKPHRANGCRLLRQADVAARIAELQREHGERAAITADRVVAEIARVAFGNIVKAFEFDAGAKRLKVGDLTSLPDELAAAISEIKIGDDGATTIKAHAKLPALELLAKYAGVHGPGIGAIVPEGGSDMERIKGALVAAIEAMARGEIASEDGQRLCQSIGVMLGAVNGQKLEDILRALKGPAIDAESPAQAALAGARI